MFAVKKVGILSSAWICNSRRGRLLFGRLWTDSTKKGGAVQTAPDSKPWHYSGTRSLQKHSIMGLTAIRLNWDQTEHWYSLLQQRMKVHLHCLKGVYAIFAGLSSYCGGFWHNTSNHRLCISSASQWKSPFGRAKSIRKRTMTYSLSYDISFVCFFHC